MPGPERRKDSLAPPGPNQGRRRSSWLDSLTLSLGFGGGGGGRRFSLAQSSTSSSEQSSDQDSSAVSAFSRLSVATLLGISGTGAAEKPKGEKARNLLRMLLKSQKSPESSGSELVTDVHSLVPCGDVVGLLAVSVKQLKDFTPKFNVIRDTSLLIRISIDKIMKCTNPQVYRATQRSSRKVTAINFGDVRYFSVKVPNQKSDTRNKIVLELIGFEGPRDFPRLFGTVTMHLYEVIQKQAFTEICPMRIRNMVFCTVEVEFMFCYGSLGYGYSHQLKLPGADPVKAVACSMFMRVPPPPNRKDHANNVITPQLMDYPSFLSPDLNVTVGNIELESPPENSDEYKRLKMALHEPPRERLVKLKQEYRSLKTWREKAEFLDQLILKRGPKPKSGLLKMSRFKQIVEKVSSPHCKESTSSGTAETVIHEEKLSGDLVTLEDSLNEIPVIPGSIFEIPIAPRLTAESDTESEKDLDFPASADSLTTVPELTITSSTAAVSHLPLGSMESMEGEIERGEVYHESETSSSEIPAEFSETGDSESIAFEGPESKAVDEEPAPPVRKESIAEYPLSLKESRSRSEVSVKFTDETEAPKPPKSVNEILPQWTWKEVEFQEAVFTGDKFEPFLRHIKGVQPPELPKGKASILSNLEKMHPHGESKEQEDQDPPHQMSPTKVASSSDTKLVKDAKQLSILRLIEKRIEQEEEEPQFPLQMDKEPKPLAIKPDLSQRQLEKTLSESEVKEVEVSFKRSVEDFLVSRLTKVIALKSLLSKHVENLVEERLLEAELSEELEDSMDTLESLPDAKGKHLLVGRKPCSGERLSEQDISNLKAAASQNLQASLIGKLSAHGIIPGMALAESNQKVSVSSSALSKESVSEADIKTLKSLSDFQSGESLKTESMPSSQENQLATGETKLESKTDDRESAVRHKSHSSSLAGTSTETGLDKERPRKSLEIIRVRLPVSTETELTKKSVDNIKPSELESEPNKTVSDALIEKLLNTEIASLKSFLSKGLHDHFKDKLSETGLSTKEDFEKVCQKLSLNVKGELTMALEKALPEGSQVSSKENLPGTHATKKKSAFSKSIQSFVLDMLSESEVANLKSVLDKKIQDHLLERLSEIGLITEEELRKVLENFFPVVTKETLSDGNNEKVSFQKGETAQSTPPLTQSLQDRFSEDELKNLKSLLNRILKEDHREKLSESEIKGLTSVLQKNFKDLPMQRSSETGISKEVEINDECRSISLRNVEESSPGGTTINVSEKEKSHAKDSISKTFLGEKLGLGRKPDLPESSAFEIEEMHKETQTNGFMSPPKKVEFKGEKTDSSVNNVFGIESTCRETQTSASKLPTKKVKQRSKKESHRLHSTDKADIPDSKRGFETVLRNKPLDEPLTRIPDPFASSSLTRISEPFASSSFLSAHDIGIQTELKNYLSRPPGYLSKPTFPVNPQTYLFLHSESEEEAKLASRCHQKPKSRKKAEKSSKKNTVSHHPQQGVINTQVKKEKTTGGLVSKDTVKEKSRRHREPPSPKLSLMDSKKDIKTKASPSLVRMESLKLKPEKKQDDIKAKKSFSKLVAPSDPHNLGENLPDKSSLTKFPAFWRAAGNTPNVEGTLDLDTESFKHLEKAIERALIDLGKVPPEGGPSQAPHSARPSTAPGIAATATELLRSLATNSSKIENPRISASSLSEIPYNQERILKMSPEQLEVILWMLQNVLRQYTRPQNNG